VSTTELPFPGLRSGVELVSENAVVDDGLGTGADE